MPWPTADPTATPPAVAAIWANRPGSLDWAAAGGAGAWAGLPYAAGGWGIAAV